MWLRINGGNIVNLDGAQEIAKISRANSEGGIDHSVFVVFRERDVSWHTPLFTAESGNSAESEARCNQFLNWLFWKMDSGYPITDTSLFLSSNNHE